MWKRWLEEQRRNRELSIATLFAPAIEKAQDDPRVLLTWQPLAATLRARFPEEFAALDAAAGSTFPFDKEFIAAAHARWTTEWLVWEKAHLESPEREKLELYQRRYEEYVRVGKALQGLAA